MQILLFLFFSLFCVGTVHAFPAQVIHIADGDTITVLDEHRKHVKIRLYGIDSPEKRQAFGHHAKQYISLLVAGKRNALVKIDSAAHSELSTHRMELT